MWMTKTKTAAKEAPKRNIALHSSNKGRRPATPPISGEKPLRVFIVDDSRLTMERLTKLLATVEGVQIVGAAQTTGAAIRGIRHLTPDLVMFDFQIPDGSAIDALKAIKQGDDPPCVIMLANRAYPQFQATCAQCGADYFLDKSQDFAGVIEICRHLFSPLSPIIPRSVTSPKSPDSPRFDSE
jgi:two-component system, NarL family, response regulator DevR